MIELVTGPHVSSLRPLFPADVPNRAILDGVLSGCNAGHVIVRDNGSRDWCVVVAAHHGFAFVGGAPTGDELTESIAALRRYGIVSIVAHEGERWPPRGVPPPDREVPRWEFSGRALHCDGAVRRIPPDCVIRRIDSETLDRCLWRDAVVGAYGSADRYFALSVGFCLVRGADLLSGAHAFFWSSGTAEIGAVTSPTVRGRGFASATACRLIEECAARGAETVWSCDQDNHGSAGVARRLGYERRRAYRLHEYLPVPTTNDPA